ncbi:MAG: polymer-forming cytoskeletal protein [Treponema sp.]|nr:polymer-forming cytoskeletal protein [Treponema sp.]
MALRIDDISINTVVGSGSAISGNLRVNGFVRVDGDIDGNLETDGNVIIGENARIRGNVKAKSIIIGGIILGNIHALDGVKLLSEAIVVGDIISHKITIENMALVHGHCISIKEEESFAAKADEYLQSQAIKVKASL